MITFKLQTQYVDKKLHATCSEVYHVSSNGFSGCRYSLKEFLLTASFDSLEIRVSNKCKTMQNTQGIVQFESDLDRVLREIQ